MNTKLHAVTDARGRPLVFFVTTGQVSDYTGAAAVLGSLPAGFGKSRTVITLSPGQ